MKRVDRKRLEALRRLKDVHDALLEDLSIVTGVLDQKTLKFTPKVSIWDLAFWGKSVLRTFLSQIEALSYTLRKLVVDFADELGVELSDEKRSELREPQLGLVESLQLSFRSFPVLFGTEYQLDLSGDGWQALATLVDIRNELTHPETVEQLMGREIYRSLAPAQAWFFARFEELLSLCAGVIPGAAPPFGFPSIPSHGYEKQIELFEKDDDSSLRPASLQSLEYARVAFSILLDDTSRGISGSTTLSKIDTLLGRNGQLGLKCWVRAFASEVECTVAVVKLVIASSKDVSLSAEDRLSLEGDFEADEQLARVLNLWSREFGAQKQIKAGGANAQALLNVLKIPHRLAHPKSPKDLRVSLKEVELMGNADNWFRDVTNAAGLRIENVAKTSE
ncbi:MAG TPA: hypothetical protein VIA62_22830 [Thermoanaerobaculia bacterium]|jgi:hypothetical protein|nr:hypothetical protein [Thermoanaerobaculia bacterium]